jgi:hypothetical protein
LAAPELGERPPIFKDFAYIFVGNLRLFRVGEGEGASSRAGLQSYVRSMNLCVCEPCRSFRSDGEARRSKAGAGLAAEAEAEAGVFASAGVGVGLDS